MNNRAADLKAVTHIDNVRLGGDEKSVVIIDQTKLPNAAEYIDALQKMYKVVAASTPPPEK